MSFSFQALPVPTAEQLGKGDPFQALLQGLQTSEAYKQAMAKSLQEQVKSQYAQPMAEESLQQARLKSKYLPLDEAIKAYQQARMTSRFGQAYQLHSALSNMDPASRSLWISQHTPEYNQMLQDLQSQSNEQGAQGYQKIISQYFPELGESPTSSNISTTLNQSGSQMPEQGVQPGLSNKQQEVVNKEQEKPQSVKNVEALQNSLGLEANRKAVSPALNKQADSAVQMETWLHEQQPEYSKVLSTINKYSSLYGKGKEWLDIIKSQFPNDYQNNEDYINLKWFQTSFIPNLINRVRQMEGLSVQKEQRDELRKMVDGLTRKDLDPLSAAKLFNKQIKTIQDISDSVFKAAEPNIKGIYRKIHNIPRFEGDYVPSKSEISKQTMPTVQNEQVLNGKKYHLISGKWYPVEEE